MKGLWIAHFNAGAAHGNGLAVLHAGEVMGGDLSHTWVGSYRQDGSSLYASVRVTPYPPQPDGEEQRERPVTVSLTGTCDEHDAKLAGYADDTDLAINIELHRAA